MNGKIEQLKILIEESILAPQLKINKIVQTLQRTEDSLKAKVLSNQIIEGNFEDLEDETIDNLIKAFDGEVKQTKNNNKIETQDDEFNNNKEESLKYELKVAQDQLKSLEKLFKDQLTTERKKNEKLQEEYNKLVETIAATKILEKVEVPDEEIDKLYIEYLQNGTIKGEKAFIINGIIPKVYYKIK